MVLFIFQYTHLGICLGPVLLNHIPDKFLGFRTVKQIGFNALINKGQKFDWEVGKYDKK